MKTLLAWTCFRGPLEPCICFGGPSWRAFRPYMRQKAPISHYYICLERPFESLRVLWRVLWPSTHALEGPMSCFWALKRSTGLHSLLRFNEFLCFEGSSEHHVWIEKAQQSCSILPRSQKLFYKPQMIKSPMFTFEDLGNWKSLLWRNQCHPLKLLRSHQLYYQLSWYQIL